MHPPHRCQHPPLSVLLHRHTSPRFCSCTTLLPRFVGEWPQSPVEHRLLIDLTCGTYPPQTPLQAPCSHLRGALCTGHYVAPPPGCLAARGRPAGGSAAVRWRVMCCRIAPCGHMQQEGHCAMCVGVWGCVNVWMGVDVCGGGGSQRYMSPQHVGCIRTMLLIATYLYCAAVA